MKSFEFLRGVMFAAVVSLFMPLGASQAAPIGPLAPGNVVLGPNTIGDLVTPVHYRRYWHCHTRRVRRCRFRTVRRCTRWRRGRCRRWARRRVWQCRRVPRTYCHRRGRRIRVR